MAPGCIQEHGTGDTRVTISLVGIAARDPESVA
jgi:hypothetical protein